MITTLANVSLLVKDYDEAIGWYTDVLGLELRMDGSMGGDYRFVTVGVKGQDDVSIVLHRPGGDYSEARSNIHGFLFHTEDCRGEVERLRHLEVKITLEPEEQPCEIRALSRKLHPHTDLPTSLKGEGILALLTGAS